MSLDNLRAWIRQIGETVRFVAPIAGSDSDARAEAIRSDDSRLSVHEAFEIGGDSDRISFNFTTSTARTFAAGAGKFIRILATEDCYVTIDQPTVGAGADDPNTDNVSIFVPFGETNFIVIPDTAQDAVLSTIGLTAAGEMYASIVR